MAKPLRERPYQIAHYYDAHPYPYMCEADDLLEVEVSL
jgi:hypothetical protein